MYAGQPRPELVCPFITCISTLNSSSAGPLASCCRFCNNAIMFSNYFVILTLNLTSYLSTAHQLYPEAVLSSNLFKTVNLNSIVSSEIIQFGAVLLPDDAKSLLPTNTNIAEEISGGRLYSETKFSLCIPRAPCSLFLCQCCHLEHSFQYNKFCPSRHAPLF